MDDTRSRIRCHCRRGVRELDDGFDRLPDRDLATFERLLEQPDLDILEWLTGKNQAGDDRLQALCVRIRSQLGY